MRDRPDQTDHSRSTTTQRYRVTPEAQRIARALDARPYDRAQANQTISAGTYAAPYRCPDCRTPHATPAEARLCCPPEHQEMDQATGLDLETLARMLGRRVGGWI